VGAVDVVPEDAVPRRFRTWVAGEVDDGTHPLHPGPEVVVVLYFTRDVRELGLFHRLAVVHEPPVVLVSEPVQNCPPHVPARSSEQYRLVHSFLQSGRADK
jgi:hypothetical protein